MRAYIAIAVFLIACGLAGGLDAADFECKRSGDPGLTHICAAGVEVLAVAVNGPGRVWVTDETGTKVYRSWTVDVEHQKFPWPWQFSDVTRWYRSAGGSVNLAFAPAGACVKQ